MKARLAVLFAVLLLPSAFAQDKPPAYECRGNEPFWSLAIKGAEGTRETPSKEENGGITTTTAWGVFKQENGWALWRGIFPDWDDTVAFITPTPCEEMSGAMSPYSIFLSLPDGDVYHGCCNRQK